MICFDPRITRINANKMPDIVYQKESYAIIGACFEVYNDKGCGFLEPVYQECLGIEFEYQRIPAIAKPPLTGTTPSSNTNASQKLNACNPKRTFRMSTFNLSASIRVIRGLLTE